MNFGLVILFRETQYFPIIKFTYIWRMNFRKYIGALVFLLSGLGIFSQYDATKPNQEIVLQFQNEITDSDYTRNTITTITEQLQAIGVHGISISEHTNGTLRISYFSEAQVSEVRRSLSKHSELGLAMPLSDSEKLPIEKEVGIYKLKVSEIQKTNDLTSGLSDRSIIVQKSDFERFLNPSDFHKHQTVNWTQYKGAIEKELCLPANLSSTPLRNPYVIPETRAGPNI